MELAPRVIQSYGDVYKFRSFEDVTILAKDQVDYDLKGLVE